MATFEDALLLFEQGKYAQAYPFFKKQTSLFPKEPKYQYYCGVCLVQMHTSPDKALTSLLYAADKPVPRDVYYFLGQLYLSQYRFTEAEDAFAKFQKYADQKLQQKWNAEGALSACENSKKAILFNTITDVYKTDTIQRDALISFYNKHVKQGLFVEKNDHTLLLQDGSPSLYFQPTHPDGITPIFEPIRSKSGQIDLAISYPKEKQKAKLTSLGSLINSQYNEGFAWFCSSNSTLYYSTCGQNSMGKFDIYKSTYNPDTKWWSVPESLGFPINSPEDDFLFVIDEIEHIAWFASNRGVSSDKVVVYTIAYNGEIKVITAPKGAKPLEIAKLKPSKKALPFTDIAEKKLTNNKQQTTKTPIVAPIRPEQNYPAELSAHEEYNQLISLALKYQVHGDSLARAANDFRQKLSTATNDIDKEKYRKNISWFDFRAQKTQLKADSLYEKARSFEQTLNSQDTRSKSISPEMSQKAFQQSTPEKKEKTKKIDPTPNVDGNVVVFEFKVMATTPYKTEADIPMDQPIPLGIIYRIQMGAFSQPIEPTRFKGIMPLYGESLQNGAIKKYYAGTFNRNSDAEKALNKVREYGFRDAYIISYYNGKNIPVSRAKDLEKNTR